jgi:hypothetical protein
MHSHIFLTKKAGILPNNAKAIFGEQCITLLESDTNKGLIWLQKGRKQMYIGKGWPHGDISIRGGKIGDNIDAVWEDKKVALEKLSLVCKLFALR